MAAKQEPNSGLFYGWGPLDGYADQMDSNLLKVGFLLRPVVISRSVTAQPVAPVAGDAYIIPPGATGAVWSGSGNTNKFAIWDASVNAWWVLQPGNFQTAVVMDEGSLGRLIVHKNGAGWSTGTALS